MTRTRAEHETTDAESDIAGEYASPACFMHEVDPAYMGVAARKPESHKPLSADFRKEQAGVSRPLFSPASQQGEN